MVTPAKNIVDVITFESVKLEELSDSKGMSYLEFRKTLKPKYPLAWGHILTGYIALVSVMAGIILTEHEQLHLFWITIPVGGVLIGYIVSALHLFLHEASHFHLMTDKKQNDLMANITLGILVGMETNFYRSVYFAHHRLIGTKEDTEKSYFEGLTPRFLFESFTGIKLFKVILHRNKNIRLNYGENHGEKIIKRNNAIFAIACVLNLSLLAVLLLSGLWQAAAAWIIGMAVMFPFFAMLRQILEHRRPEAKASVNYNLVDPGASHRIFGDGPIASTLGAAGFNRHLIHHWDPSVSYTRLKDVEDYLMDTPLRDELIQSRTTYFKTFAALLNK